MSEITIVETTGFEQHNVAFDEAQLAYEKQLSEWRHKVDAIYQSVRDEDPEADLADVDLTGIEEPERPDVPPTVPALRVAFKEGDDDHRNLYVCVPASATTADIKKAIKARLDEVTSLEESVKAGDTFKV